MIKLLTLIVTILVVILPTVQASQSKFAAAFREKLIGAEPLALGGAYTAGADDPLALIWNPALLQNQAFSKNLIIEHSQFLDFVEYSFIGYTHQFNPLLTAGIGFLHNGDDLMSENIGYLAIASDITLISDLIEPKMISKGRAKAGITFKYYYSSFGSDDGWDFFDDAQKNHRVSGSASGIGLDLGIGVNLTERDYFGSTFKNLLTSINWDSENEAGTTKGSYSENLPIEWILGYARDMNRWKIGIDLHKSISREIEDTFFGGIEYALTKDFLIRGGYSQELVTADNKKLMAGIGLNIKTPGLVRASMNFTYLIYNQWPDNNSVLFSISLPAKSAMATDQ